MCRCIYNKNSRHFYLGMFCYFLKRSIKMAQDVSAPFSELERARWLWVLETDLLAETRSGEKIWILDPLFSLLSLWSKQKLILSARVSSR